VTIKSPGAVNSVRQPIPFDSASRAIQLAVGKFYLHVDPLTRRFNECTDVSAGLHDHQIKPAVILVDLPGLAAADDDAMTSWSELTNHHRNH
jgi:hypothetical protein